MYTEKIEAPGAGFAGGGSVGRGRASGFDRSPLQCRLGTVVVVVVDLVAVGDVLCRVHARRVVRRNATCVDASTEREGCVDGRSPGWVKVRVRSSWICWVADELSCACRAHRRVERLTGSSAVSDYYY